jgi:hypothetical protein
MDSELGQFLREIAAHWWLWVVAAVLAGDQALRAASGAYRQRTDRWLKPGWRGALSLAAAVAVVLAAGFLAFTDVAARLADSEKRLAETVVLRPRLDLLETTTERLPDGTYRISKLVEIVSRTPPGRLQIAATARGIMDLKIEPQAKRGMMIHGPSAQNGDTITDRIQGPVGKYMLIIRAAGADVTLVHHFE